MHPTDKPNDSILFLAKLPLSNSSAAHIRTEEGKNYNQLASVPELDPKTDITLAAYGFDGELPENTIAFHPIYGSVMYGYSWWRFSTKQFLEDLAAAEANPSVVAHLIHVDSNGGEAFGCHEAFEAVKNLTKPCIAVIESMAASAGYYLCCAADKVYASSMFSEIGCIGTMCVMINDAEYMKKHGLEEHEYYSNYSPLKNKIINDALAGDGAEYIKKFLDPLALQFISDVKSVRSAVSDDSEASQGEIFYAANAQAQGLIDGECTIQEAVDELIGMMPKPKTNEPSIDINSINL